MEIALWILGVLVLAIGIAVSIGLHELGHFYPARKFGVFVGSFMIGFGPTLWSRKFGETEFGVKAVPLGGYVSLSGMYPTTANADKPGFRMFRKLVQDARDASAETITDDSRAFYRLPVLQRIIVMLGGPLMNLVIATVLFLFLFTGIGVVGATTTIGSISECVLPVTSTRTACASGDPKAPAAEAGLKPGDRVGVWSPNNAEWTLTQFATAKAGIILVNINPAYRVHERTMRSTRWGALPLSPLMPSRAPIMWTWWRAWRRNWPAARLAPCSQSACRICAR